MYNISQYINAIETTVVPSRLSDIEKSKLFEPVNNIILNNLPIKLYRFRSCNERHLSALYNDELWFSNGSEVNDDFDARLFYNKNEVVAGIKKQVSENGQLIVIELLKSLSFCIFRGGGAACPAWREPRVRTRRSHPFELTRL